jgi:hypothetical protein
MALEICFFLFSFFSSVFLFYNECQILINILPMLGPVVCNCMITTFHRKKSKIRLWWKETMKFLSNWNEVCRIYRLFLYCSIFV